MKKRCLNPKNKNFSAYGGRGITVCERWLNDFAAFLADMGPRPTPRHSIERRNNDLGYSPDNCRWATQREQCNNLRKNVRLTFNGETLTISQWGRRLGSVQTLRSRLEHGWSVERALTEPRRKLKWHPRLVRRQEETRPI